ncbi:MAG: TIGR04452 family lipoprotein [Leptospiraceae bacterium]|nr:TIGR04452 family lipoprotein [Leptospiraceae bacterium]MCP5512971.1 TIGR04452 family lipoprotein [Leptospiraceae bacterium]
MKKFILVLLFVFNHCVVFDSVGLTYPESVSGKEAKDMIITKALIGAVACVECSSGGLLGFFADRLAFIEEDAFYDKSDVETCAQDAMLINSLSADIGGFQCHLTKHKKFVNWPIQLF